ncbi:hypothetical protein AQI88_24025 [Streptomyces cellostaticus]|uniref:Uncharacterized protein n=1 Tax=Streptomyces cellostaticus TaxID=67285 RepID=A0A101NJI0_9ACTN|nr:hypothetical protein [Streptomyces cellostaticus]KUM94051.1 hypothetical protein AQI88_24025 [Streptomyces cellostaticus]GHI05015.1 hypothetical protein Scel_33360 [Streptomyces cellostaticus]
MNTPSAQRHDERAAPSGGGLATRVLGAAGTGAALTCLSLGLVDSANRYDSRTCANAPDFCMTVWPAVSLPVAFAIALVGLVVAYRLLGIRPRLAVIPPTLLLAPFPLDAAESVAGLWPATVAGAVWAAALALTVWRPYRILGLSAAAALLLGSFVVVYR